MKPGRRSFLFTSLLGFGLTNACTKAPPPPPPNSTAPALDTASEREISYLVEREDQGHAVSVSEDFQFKSGDRFRLSFRPGFLAFIYLANRGRDETSYKILFPMPTEHTRNPLAKGQIVAVPGDNEWMHFDQSPGNEYLVLIASTVALPDLENAGVQIPYEAFEAQLAGIDRRYRPQSSRRFQDGDWIKLFAAREGALAIVVRLALQHQIGPPLPRF